MSIAYQGSGAAFNTTSSASWSVELPPIVRDKWLLRAVVFNRGAPNITMPAGWTAIQESQVGVSFALNQYYKIADGTETGSITVGLASAQGGFARVGVFSGVDPLNPLVGTIQTATADTAGTNANLVFPSLVGTIPAGAWVVRTAGSNVAANNPHSHTPPSSPAHTELWDFGGPYNTLNSQGALSSSYYELASAGTVAGATGTASINVLDVDQTFALRPGAGRGPRIGMIG